MPETVAPSPRAPVCRAGREHRFKECCRHAAISRSQLLDFDLGFRLPGLKRRRHQGRPSGAAAPASFSRPSARRSKQREQARGCGCRLQQPCPGAGPTPPGCASTQPLVNKPPSKGWPRQTTPETPIASIRGRPVWGSRRTPAHAGPAQGHQRARAAVPAGGEQGRRQTASAAGSTAAATGWPSASSTLNPARAQPIMANSARPKKGQQGDQAREKRETDRMQKLRGQGKNGHST